jgi:hypothetical protein
MQTSMQIEPAADQPVDIEACADSSTVSLKLSSGE